MRLSVVVTPKASSDSIDGWRTDAAGKRELSCRVASVPENGKATAAACKLVAESIGIPKKSVRCVRGATSRHKQLEIDCPQGVFDAWERQVR